MCLIIVHWQPNSTSPLQLISNRDEFYRRPSRAAHYWQDFPHIYGGRDLEQQGTWLAISTSGKLAAVTNYRDQSTMPHARSRGNIPVDFLKQQQSAQQFSRTFKDEKDQYQGVNALLYDGKELVFLSNRDTDLATTLAPGTYGLSNHLLDTPWPKVIRAKQAISEILNNQQREGSTSIAEEATEQRLLDAMHNTQLAATHDLPATGLSLEIERMLSPMFIRSAEYGTRTSTVVTFKRDGTIRFAERNYLPGQNTFEQRCEILSDREAPSTKL